MIDLELARGLREAGLVWTPANGDVFVIDMPDLAHQTFVLSDLTVDVHEFGGERVLAFNGTTEWALDSVTMEQALWLPHEHQLRAALGTAFTSLATRPGGRLVVTVSIGDSDLKFVDPDGATAYARAVLHVLSRGAR